MTKFTKTAVCLPMLTAILAMAAVGVYLSMLLAQPPADNAADDVVRRFAS